MPNEEGEQSGDMSFFLFLQSSENGPALFATLSQTFSWCFFLSHRSISFAELRCVTRALLLIHYYVNLMLLLFVLRKLNKH